MTVLEVRVGACCSRSARNRSAMARGRWEAGCAPRDGLFTGLRRGPRGCGRPRGAARLRCGQSRPPSSPPAPRPEPELDAAARHGEKPAERESDGAGCQADRTPRCRAAGRSESHPASDEAQRGAGDKTAAKAEPRVASPRERTPAGTAARARAAGDGGGTQTPRLEPSRDPAAAAEDAASRISQARDGKPARGKASEPREAASDHAAAPTQSSDAEPRARRRAPTRVDGQAAVAALAVRQAPAAAQAGARDSGEPEQKERRGHPSNGRLRAEGRGDRPAQGRGAARARQARGAGRAGQPWGAGGRARRPRCQRRAVQGRKRRRRRSLPRRPGRRPAGSGRPCRRSWCGTRR